ncbi:zinc-dependent metalloprotease [Ekhidna sp.]
MMRLGFKVLLLVTCFSLIGQTSPDLGCGTEATQEQIDFMNSFSRVRTSPSNRAVNNFAPVRVPVQFFLLRNSDNSGGLETSRTASLIDEVNDIYAAAGMTFFEVSDPIIVANDNFYNLDSSQENELAASRDKPGVINIYVSNNLTSGGSQLCGYTRFPPSADRVFLATACADNEFGTTAHELGHYFTLYHTHGKTNNGTTDELVTRGAGANCTVAGDDLCDTAADPNLSGQVSGCSYTGSAVDANGQAFGPDPSNIMSYAPNSCRTSMSAGQFERIRDGMEQGRNYLNLIYENFTAAFVSDVRVGCAPLIVKFTDETSTGSSRNWSFPGSDKESSTARNVFVTYDEPGFYDVTLTVTNDSGEESIITRENYILVKDPFENLIQDTTLNTFNVEDIPSKWTIDNDDSGTSWEYNSSSVDEGSGSYFVNNYNYGAELLPQYDDLNLSSIDLNDINSLTIEFSYAYTHSIFEDGVSVLAYDTLLIGYKLDCDQEINQLEKIGGEELRTTSAGSNIFFIPTDDEWSTISTTIVKTDISGYKDLSSITPVIQSQSGNGNNLYIDRVHVIPDFSLDSLEFFRGKFENEGVLLRWANSAVNSRSVIIERSIDNGAFEELVTLDPSQTEYTDTDFTIEEVESIRYRGRNVNSVGESSLSEIAEVTPVLTSTVEKNNFKVYPNPTKGNISVVTEINSVYSIEIMDLSGRVVKKVETNQNETQVDLSSLEGGLFFVRVNDGRSTTLRKIVKLD